MNDVDLIDALEGLQSDLSARVSDFPGPTCPDIDKVIADIRPVRKEADRLTRNAPDSREFEAFASDVDSAIYDLPDTLEELRQANHALRSALHEALDSRKAAAAEIDKLIQRLTAIVTVTAASAAHHAETIEKFNVFVEAAVGSASSVVRRL